MGQFDNVAGKLVASVRDMVPGRFVIEPTTPATHPHVQWEAYTRVREIAAGLGLRHLGDVDITSIRHDLSMMRRPVLAIYTNRDGTEVIGHYRLALRWTPMGILARLLGGRGDMFDVGTNFGGGDGVTLETTSAAAAGVWNQPEWNLREMLPKGTPLPQMLERHRGWVRDYRAQHPEAQPTAIRTLQDIVAISDRMEQRKLEWRRQLGWATRDELARISKMTGPQLNELYAAFRKAADRTTFG